MSVQFGEGHIVHLLQGLAGGHVSVAAVVVARIGTGEVMVMVVQTGGRYRWQTSERLTWIHETAILAHHVSSPLGAGVLEPDLRVEWNESYKCGASGRDSPTWRTLLDSPVF